MPSKARVALIIPALNEASAIAQVLAEVPSDVARVVVVDNGSTDDTAEVAAAAGADVVREAARGYGRACLAGIARAADCEVLVFADGDGSDDLRDIPSLLQPIAAGQADLVVGSRTRGQREPGSLTPVQVFGNWLTCGLVRLFWGARFTDLGPLRAIRRDTLQQLAMADPDFGWTVEMQVKAAQRRLRVLEIPVRYRRRRAGRSKVSGTLTGSYKAGKRILGYVLSAKLEELISWRGA